MATRDEWSKRVDRWQKSGLSAEDFAAREHIESKRLVWWRWKLRSARPSPPTPAALQFLPVRVVESVAGPPSGVVLEVVLPNGRIVRIPRGFDPTMLESVLSIASGGA